MKKILAPLAIGLVSLAIVSTSNDAHALGPVDIEIGAKAGFATNPNGDLAYNPLGVGVGGRAGVSFFKIYGGVNVMYYLGGSQDIQGTSISTHTLQYGLEAGYGISVLDLLTIRPQLGFGNLTFTSSGGSFSSSDSNLYLEPGVVGLVSLGGFFVGADANVLLIPGVKTGVDASGNNTTKTYTSLSLHAQVGVKF